MALKKIQEEMACSIGHSAQHVLALIEFRIA